VHSCQTHCHTGPGMGTGLQVQVERDKSSSADSGDSLVSTRPKGFYTIVQTHSGLQAPLGLQILPAWGWNSRFPFHMTGSLPPHSMHHVHVLCLLRAHLPQPCPQCATEHTHPKDASKDKSFSASSNDSQDGSGTTALHLPRCNQLKCTCKGWWSAA
jgi:hypothetical protein